MRQKVALAATAAVLLLALSGCAGANAADDDASAPRSATPTPSAAPTSSSAPLVASSPAPSAGENTAGFLTFVRGRLATFPSQIPNATDQQLIDAGHQACDRIRAGEPIRMMSVIEGEQRAGENHEGYYLDSNAIIAGAQMNFCTDTIKTP